MRAASNGRRATQRGSVMVESALTLTIFLTIVFGLIDLGRAVWVHNAISHLAREGSRYAMVRGATHSTPATSAQISERVVARSFAIDKAALKVTTSWQEGNQPGKPVAVDVSYTFRPYLPLIPVREVAMRSRSVMTISR